MMKYLVVLAAAVWVSSVPIDDTAFAVRLSAKGTTIALIDTTTDTVVSKKRLHSRSASSTKLYVRDYYSDGQPEAIVVAKRKTSNVTVHVVAIKTAAEKLQIKDVVTVKQSHIVPGKTKFKRKTIRLRNKLGETIAQYKVKSNDTLSNTTETLSTEVELGDEKYSTSSAQPGYVYLCQEQGVTGGATEDGPWIHGDTWDYAEKDVTVDGAVAWDNANVTITTSGDDRIITSTGLPEGHTTGEYPIATDDDAYQYDQNPNSITEQSISITVPVNPTESNNPNCVGGEVGIALTGVAIFNAMDALNRDAVAHEIQDTYGGHPEITGMYHYHTISDLVAGLADEENSMTLVGYAFDGFGIFDETEFGKTLRTADLDKCHGHDHEITWDGDTVDMYHYHVTKDYPYTVSCFKGESSVVGPLVVRRRLF